MEPLLIKKKVQIKSKPTLKHPSLYYPKTPISSLSKTHNPFQPIKWIPGLINPSSIPPKKNLTSLQLPKTIFKTQFPSWKHCCSIFMHRAPSFTILKPNWILNQIQIHPTYTIFKPKIWKALRSVSPPSSLQFLLHKERRFCSSRWSYRKNRYQAPFLINTRFPLLVIPYQKRNARRYSSPSPPK